jgi:hypothetical protein
LRPSGRQRAFEAPLLPFWQTRPCPEWCTQAETGHRVNEQPTDRSHYSDALAVELTLEAAEDRMPYGYPPQRIGAHLVHVGDTPGLTSPSTAPLRRT